MADRYAVMGHPIAHSKSPFIHARFAAQTGQALVYQAIHVLPGDFARAVAQFQAAGGQGLNITLPFKEQAFALADVRTRRALEAEAVNTLWFDSAGRCYGDNTDGVGLIRDLCENHGMTLAGKRILLLGAGGAVRGVLGPLMAARPAIIICANRTLPRAEALVARFASGNRLAASAFPALEGLAFDLIINATSASLQGTVPPLPEGILKEGGWCYDLAYADGPTAFVQWGFARGASRSVDGLGMLVEQAAESFYRWRGVRPATAPVIAALRASLGEPGAPVNDVHRPRR